MAEPRIVHGSGHGGAPGSFIAPRKPVDIAMLRTDIRDQAEFGLTSAAAVRSAVKDVVESLEDERHVRVAEERFVSPNVLTLILLGEAEPILDVAQAARRLETDTSSVVAAESEILGRIAKEIERKGPASIDLLS